MMLASRVHFSDFIMDRVYVKVILEMHVQKFIDHFLLLFKSEFVRQRELNFLVPLIIFVRRHEENFWITSGP